MHRYGTLDRVLMLAVWSVGILACEDRRATPLEPAAAPDFELDTEGGWTTVEGIEYYVHEGGYYPREGVTASIWDPKTTGDVWPYAASINAFFDFRGHGATQSTTWKLTRLSSGAHIDGAKAENFGSHSGVALSPFKKRYSGSISVNHPYECDLRLSASSEHSAWWMGIVISSSSPFISPGKWGVRPAYSSMEDRTRPCGFTDGGGGGGACEGDYCEEPEESTCTECQQWLYYSASGDYLYDEWECAERSGTYCEMLMS